MKTEAPPVQVQMSRAGVFAVPDGFRTEAAPTP